MSSAFRCIDCGNITYLTDTYEGTPGIGDPYISKTEFFPPLPSRIKPDWYSNLPKRYQIILDEVYQALDNSLPCLASIGSRTVLDLVMVDHIGDIGTFEQKVDKLIQQSIIPIGDKDIVVSLIDAGSAAAHRRFYPNKTTLKHIIDILEEILFKVVVVPKKQKVLIKKANALRKVTPKRKKP